MLQEPPHSIILNQHQLPLPRTSHQPHHPAHLSADCFCQQQPAHCLENNSWHESASWSMAALHFTRLMQLNALHFVYLTFNLVQVVPDGIFCWTVNNSLAFHSRYIGPFHCKCIFYEIRQSTFLAKILRTKVYALAQLSFAVGLFAHCKT